MVDWNYVRYVVVTLFCDWEPGIVAAFGRTLASWRGAHRSTHRRHDHVRTQYLHLSNFFLKFSLDFYVRLNNYEERTQ